MKRIALYFLAAAALLVGCNEKNIDTPSVDTEDAWMYDETLPVPIRFSADNGSLTKGAINSVTDMVGKTFGFYAINSGIDPEGGAWSIKTDIQMPQGAMATCEEIGDGKVRFNFVEGPYYYGQTDWTPYTFYGYYAHIDDINAPDYSEDQTENLTSDYIYVLLNIGHTDILWGKAAPEAPGSVTTSKGSIAYGFNAPYLRNGGKQPFMTFKHVTACVEITAQVEASQQVGADPINMTVAEFMALDVPVQDALFIAHKDEAKEGCFAGQARVVKDTLFMSGIDTEKLLSNTPEALGDPLFLAPTAGPVNTELKYMVNGKEFKTKIELNPQGGFVAGYRYKYNLKIAAPEQIIIEATVEEYKDAWVGSTDIDVDKE